MATRLFPLRKRKPPAQAQRELHRKRKDIRVNQEGVRQRKGLSRNRQPNGWLQMLRTDSSGHSKTAYSATERTDMGKLGTAVNMAVASSVPSITIMNQGKSISIQRTLYSRFSDSIEQAAERVAGGWIRTDSSGHSKTAYSVTQTTDMGKLRTAVCLCCGEHFSGVFNA